MTSYPTPKLVLDKTLSAALLIVLSPVFAFLLVAMGLDALLRQRDRGPWLYREPRVSRGREFDLLKFRTLRRDVLDEIDPAESHARLHEADETNLTWAGRRLLKPRYLDELPQIWNVFRGDMSLVGPRPWPPAMVATQVEKGFTYRNEFVAGWTGQLSNSSNKVMLENASGTKIDEVDYNDDGDWVMFSDVDLTGATNMFVRMASIHANGRSPAYSPIASSFQCAEPNLARPSKLRYGSSSGRPSSVGRYSLARSSQPVAHTRSYHSASRRSRSPDASEMQ